MKTKWLSKVLTGLFAFALIFGTASFANAKGPDKEKSNENHQSQPAVGDQKTSSSVKKPTEEQKGKSENKKGTSKKAAKKKDAVTSKVGKEIEKRLNSSETAIKKITLSINSYFGVNSDGTAEKDLSKKDASSKYNSFKGKLNAEINKLRAIDKQLNKKKFKSVAELDALIAKSQELQQLAADEIESVKKLAIEAATPKPEDGTGDTTTPGDTTTTDGSGDTTTTNGTTDSTSPAGTTDSTQPADQTAPTEPTV